MHEALSFFINEEAKQAPAESSPHCRAPRPCSVPLILCVGPTDPDRCVGLEPQREPAVPAGISPNKLEVKSASS